MLTKNFSARYESTTDTPGGMLIAYASTFDREPDSYGDVVARGAFLETLQDWSRKGAYLPLLFGHRTDDPSMNLGRVVEASEDETGLRIVAEFDPDSETAQYTRKLVKEGRLSTLSFAYEVLDAGPVTLEDGRKANELRKLKLYEVSLVPIPANDHAEVIDVKNAPVDEPNADGDSDGAPSGVVDEVCAEKADDLSDESPDVDAQSESIDTIISLADRIDDIADAIKDLAKRLDVLIAPIDNEPQSVEADTDAKAAEAVADADEDDNAEAPHEGNAEISEKANAMLAMMARYIELG